MFFKKKIEKQEIEFAAAMRLALGTSLRGSWEEAANALREQEHLMNALSGRIPDVDIARLRAELPVLETVLWLLRFVETVAAKRVAVDSSDEFFELFGVALLLALRDGGVPEAEVHRVRDELVDGFEDFGEAVASAAKWFGPSAALLLGMPANASHSGTGEIRIGEMREPFGLACVRTARRVAPGLVFTDAADMDRWSQLSHVAQQVDERQTTMWARFLDQHRLVNR